MQEMVAAKPLLGRPEQVLYGRLVRAFPGHVILAHVALSRLLAVDRAAAATEGPAIATRGRQLVADFVVCRPDFTALAVVELEDRAIGRDAQRDRNRRKDELLQSAGIKVVRLAANDLPNEPALKALIAALPVKSSTAQLMQRAS
jgi:Protein of unknown function (DUF2726)